MSVPLSTVSASSPLPRLLEVTTLGLLTGAAGVGMLTASGHSATGRLIFALLATVMMLTACWTMAAQGQLRLVKSFIWLPALAFLALLAFQTLPLPLPWAGTPKWLAPEATLAGSVNRHATGQALLWATAGVGVIYVASLVLCSRWRISVLVAVLASVLTVSAVVGGLQTVAGNGNFFGLVHPADSRLPLWTRDVLQPQTGLSLTAYGPCVPSTTALPVSPTVSGSAETATVANGLWYERASSPPRAFCGFANPRDWAVCALMLVPVLLLTGLSLAAQASWENPNEWRLRGDGQASLALLGMALLLAAAAAWFGDPLAAGAVALFSFVMIVGSASTGGRRLAILAGLLLVSITLSLAVLQVRHQEGLDTLHARARTAWSDNRSLLRVLADHRVFGCGAGTIADVWPLYRPSTATTPVQAGSLFVLGAELGAVGLGLWGVTALGLLLAFRRAAARLADPARLQAAALLAGLMALALVGLFGPGWQTPAVLALACLLLGSLVRGLAGGWTAAAGEDAC